MDFKDILNVQTTPTHGMSAPSSAPSTPVSARKKPDVSRELLALTGGRAPVMVSASPSQAILRGGLKEKRKVFEKLQKWEWKPFINPARAPDTTRFFHWARSQEEGEYPFGKLNKKIKAFMYTDEEWNTVIKEMDDANNLTDQSLPHRTWTREETDELFKLCREYDLRFIVIHDRYTQDPTRPITIEQMKKRYYEVARKLAETRITDPELAAKNPVINTPYDYEGEIKRKQQLDLIYTRPRDVEARENALREQLRKIENIKKKRADEERKKEKRTEKRGKGKKKGKKKGGQVDAGEQPQEQQQGDRKLPQEKKQDGDKLPSQDKELPDQQDANGGDKEREDDQVDEQDSLVANVIKQLKPGAYARSALMSAIEKGEADSMIDTVMQEHGIIKTPMPTSKIHEAYEQLRGRITALLDLKLKVGKNELLNMKLNQQREKVVQGEKRKKPETSETIDGDDAERPNKKKKLM